MKTNVKTDKEKSVIQISREINEQVEELIGGVHHEINNINFIVQGSAELMADNDELSSILNDSLLNKDLSQDTKNVIQQIKNLLQSKEGDNRAKLDQIEEKVKQISNLLKQLRSVIKSSDDQDDYFSLQEIALTVSQMCKKRFNNHQVLFKTTLDNSIQIKGKKNQIVQAFLNILNSSYDAIASSKKKEKWIDFSFIENKGKLEVLIKDSSPLISEKEVSKLFDSEYRNEGRKGYPLVISKNIVEENNGSLEYKVVDGSNCFVISFDNYSNSISNSLQAEVLRPEQQIVASKRPNLKIVKVA